MDSMSAKSIGVDGIKVTGSDSTNADKAVDTISDAIKKVSKQRSALGAVQNRLEHTISNLDNVVENTTSAESRIRDTDMAEEMVSYSKNNTSSCRQVSLCLHRLISRIRVFFHFFSNLDYRNNLSSLWQTVKVRLRDFLYIIKNKETLAKYRRICYDTYTVRQKQLQKTYIYGSLC